MTLPLCNERAPAPPRQPRFARWNRLRGFESLLAAPAVLLGAEVMHRHGLPATVWSQNLLALLAGMTICAGANWRGPFLQNGMVALLVLLITPIALLATFLFPGITGVHRWARLGGVQLHVAELLLPLFIISMESMRHRVGPTATRGAALLIAAMLAIQPDAAQATAFATAATLLLFITEPDALLTGTALLGCAAIAWFRPDPLRPVPHVEGITRLASTLTPPLAWAALASLALLPVSFLLIWLPHRASPRGNAALAAALYFVILLLAPITGKFPVPLMGYGVSPILGFFLAHTCLAKGLHAMSRRVSASEEPRT